jgi:leucine dehydrogenase
MTEHGHEQLVTCFDCATGLRALIALHDTRLGPALGGTRLWPYESGEAAVMDVLRLSEGMTYKAAVAGLPLGGGKSVILGDGRERNQGLRAQRLQAFGRMVDSLSGRYIAAEDVGTTPMDMVEMKQSTRHVVGLPLEAGGSGDPSPMTAYGVMEALRTLVAAVLHTDRLADVRVSVQGLGKVGIHLAARLISAGAHVVATDIRREACENARSRLGVEIVEPEAIYDLACDIYAPCALGGVINDRTLPRLRCRIIAGSANNQLEDDRHGEALHEMGIVYGVDYVVNAGGLINVAQELEGYDEERARERTALISHTVRRMLELARAQGISENRAARRLALERLKSAIAPAARGGS